MEAAAASLYYCNGYQGIDGLVRLENVLRDGKRVQSKLQVTSQ
jgi:hypothetical protein